MKDLKCDKHIYYSPKKPPKYPCSKCLQLYMMLWKGRIGIHKPTKTIKSKKDKEKYKKDYDAL